MPNISFSVKPRSKTSAKIGKKIDCGTASTKLKIGENDFPMVMFSPMMKPTSSARGAPMAKAARTRTRVSPAFARKSMLRRRPPRVTITVEGGGRMSAAIQCASTALSQAARIATMTAICVIMTRAFNILGLATKYMPLDTHRPLALASRRGRSSVYRLLVLIAEVERDARISAGGLVEAINGQGALERMGGRARTIAHGGNANLGEDIGVAPHA